MTSDSLNRIGRLMSTTKKLQSENYLRKEFRRFVLATIHYNDRLWLILWEVVSKVRIKKNSWKKTQPFEEPNGPHSPFQLRTYFAYSFLQNPYLDKSNLVSDWIVWLKKDKECGY